MKGTNKAHTDSKKKRKRKKNINIIIIMKQIKTRQNMYSYKYVPVVTANNTPLKSIDKFCYLGSIMSNSSFIGHIAEASSSFGRLRARFFIHNSGMRMARMPFHPFCSQGQNKQNVANAFCTNHSHSRIVNKKNAL